MTSDSTTPEELLPDMNGLIDHLHQCEFARSPLYGLQCVADSLSAFLAPRFVTTLTVVTLVVLAGVSLRG